MILALTLSLTTAHAVSIFCGPRRSLTRQQQVAACEARFHAAECEKLAAELPEDERWRIRTCSTEPDQAPMNQLITGFFVDGPKHFGREVYANASALASAVYQQLKDDFNQASVHRKEVERIYKERETRLQACEQNEAIKRELAKNLHLSDSVLAQTTCRQLDLKLAEVNRRSELEDWEKRRQEKMAAPAELHTSD